MISLLKQRTNSNHSPTSKTMHKLTTSLSALTVLLLSLILTSEGRSQVTENQLLSEAGQIFTTNDGVTFDQHVSSIDLKGSQGISIPLENQRLNTNLDYSVMLWFKPKSPLWGQEFAHLFSFPESLSCFFSPDQTLICQANNFDENIKTDIKQVHRNQWTHVAVGGSSKTTSYVQVTQNLAGVIDQKIGTYIELIQKNPSWSLCVGGCNGRFSFIGGVRELAFYNRIVGLSEAIKIQNEIKFWRAELLAYYRFGSTDSLKDEFRSNFANVVQGSYSIESDLIPNDICYPIHETQNFMNFRLSKDIQPISIDGRWTRREKNYGFSASIWLRIDENSCTNPNRIPSSIDCFLIHLNQVFMLYSPAPNQIAAYILGEKVFLNMPVPSVRVPTGQWINVQFAFSYFDGYELRVYDILGREQASIVERRLLVEQATSQKELQLLRGFSGQVRSIQVFAERKPLPLEESNLSIMPNTYYINDTNCLAFFQFQRVHVNRISLQNRLTNYCRTIRQGFNNATLTNLPSEVAVTWKDLNFNDYNSADFSPVKENVFDGIACNDGQQVVRLANTQSSIYARTSPVENPITNLTVEFWFKLDGNASETQHLLQLWALEGQKEYFSIFYDTTQQLVCAPFGLDSIRSPYISYEAFNASEDQGWMHIACAYERQVAVRGFLNNGTFDYTNMTSLTSDTTLIPNDTFRIFIGNNQSMESVTVGLMVKEFRLWGSMRSANDIKMWRYKQIDVKSFSFPSLMVYIKFNQGNLQDINLVDYQTSSNNVRAVTFNNIELKRDSLLNVCPVHTFLSKDLKCYQNPVQYLVASVYPEVQAPSNTFNWVFTVADSVLLDSIHISQAYVTWTFEDPIIQSIVSSQNLNTQQTMRVPASSFRDQGMYKVRVTFTNPDSTFFEYKDISFVAQSCQYYIVANSDARNAFLVQTDPQGLSDIQFQFSLISRRNDCAQISFFNQILRRITYEVSPPVSNMPNFEYVYNANNTISVILPKSEQGKLPIDTNLKFVFKLQWTNSQLDSQIQNAISPDLVFQNIQYSIKFTQLGQQIVPSLVSNSTAVLRGEGILLDSSATTITNSVPEDLQKLRYAWTCPGFLASFCQSQTQKTLLITYDTFTTNQGVMNETYNFTLTLTFTLVNNLEVSESRTVSVRWIDLDTTSLNIIAPQPVLSTAESQVIEAQFLALNNSALPSNLQISWNFTPNIVVTNSSFSSNNRTLTVPKGAFAVSTSYSIVVTAFYQGLQQETSRSQTLNFRTSQPPTGGQVTINPNLGFVRQTNFSVQLTNWQSSNRPIRFRVWYTTNSGGQVPRAPISTSYTPEAQSFIFQAVDTFPYIVEITDQSSEVTFVKITPTVTVAPNPDNSTNTTTNNGTNWNVTNSTQLSAALSAPQLSMRYQLLTQIVQEQETSQTSEDQDFDSQSKIVVKKQVIDVINSDIDSMNERTAEENKLVTSSSLDIISIMLKDENTVDEDLVTKSLTTVQRLESVDKSTFKQLRRGKKFKDSLGNVVSSAMKFAKRISKIGRGLEQEETTTITEQVRILKQGLLDQLCEDSVINQDHQKFEADAFHLVTQKFDLANAFSTTTFASLANLTFDLEQMMNQLIQSSPSTETFCMQTTFYKVDPQPFLNNNFSRYSSSVVQFEIVDFDTGFKFTNTHYNPGQSSLISFNIAEPTEFQTNQSVCMQFSESTQTWDDEFCATEINQANMTLDCRCNMMDSLYFGVYTDESRIRGEQLKPKLQETNHTQVEENPQVKNQTHTDTNEMTIVYEEETMAFVAVVIILLLFTTIVPALAIIQDKKDIKNATETKLSNQQSSLVKQLALASGKQINYWMYRIDELPLYTSTPSSMIFQQSHPLANLFFTFDVEEKRIWRFTSMLFSFSLFSIICVLLFGPNYRKSDSHRLESGLDQQDINASVLIGLFGMVLMMPLPFRKQIFRDKIKQSQATNARALNYLPEVNSEASPSKPQNTHIRINSANEAGYNSREQLSSRPLGSEQEPLVIEKQCTVLRYLMLAVSVTMTLVSIVLCFVYSNQMPASNQYCLVAAFYIGFFGSNLVSNMIRSILSVFLVERVSTNKNFFLQALVSYEALQTYDNMQIYASVLSSQAPQEEKQLKQANYGSLCSSKKQLNLDVCSSSQTQHADISNDLSLMKRQSASEDLDNAPPVHERLSLIQEQAKDAAPFSMKLSPKSVTQMDLQNSGDDSLREKNQSSSRTQIY